MVLCVQALSQALPGDARMYVLLSMLRKAKGVLCLTVQVTDRQWVCV